MQKVVYGPDRERAEPQKTVVWDIGDQDSHGDFDAGPFQNPTDWGTIVDDILDDVFLEVVAAVAEANADTRITLSRASRTC
jgi:hypothetical protein